MALKQELSLAEQELRHLSSVAASVKAERDAEVRELYEKSLKLDAELRVIESMHAELDRVRADIEKLCVIKQEMIKDLNEINGDLAKARDESKDMAAIKAEIETERQEIHKGRYKKKFNFQFFSSLNFPQLVDYMLFRRQFLFLVD